MIPEPVLNIWVVLKGFSIFQCLFFSSLILTTKNENPRAQKFLVLILLIIALEEAYGLLVYSRYIFQMPQLIALVDPLLYCLGPLIYFYTLTLINSSFSWRPKHLIYFLPAMAMYMLFLPFYLQPSAYKFDVLLAFFDKGTFNLKGSYVYLVLNFNMFLVLISSFVFLGLSLYNLYQFNVRIRQLYASIDLIKLRWLVFLLILASVVWIVNFLDEYTNSSTLSVLELIAFPIFVFLISYYDIRQKRVPVNMPLIPEPAPAASKVPVPALALGEEEPVKYARSGFNEDMLEELSVRLMKLIHQEKVHTQNELSLQELATLLETSSHKLSQLLNEKMQQSFYEFINYHRVQEVKNRLASDEYSHLKILAIAFDAGFNSKTTFNTVFKKHTGLSPSEYRKKQKSA